MTFALGPVPLLPEPAAAAGQATTASAQALVDMVHLAPMMIVGIWSLIVLVADAFARPGLRRFQQTLTLLGLGLAVLAAVGQFGHYEYDGGIEVFSGFLYVDQFALLVDLGILGVAGAVVLFAGDYNRSHRFEYGEHESLVLIATFGVMILAHAGDLVALFLGIETMSIAVYVMVGARWNSRQSPEAALKYFVMGAFSSGLLLMGIALVYGATGVTGLDQLSHEVSTVFTKWRAAQDYVAVVEAPEGFPAGMVDMAQDKVALGIAPAALLIPGVLLVLGALLFKVSAVPFHMWTPDAYEGAPSPTTAFMAAGVKIGAFAALLKLFVGTFIVGSLVQAPYGWTSVVLWLAAATMIVGNLAAVRQTNVKRLLAYSSVAHVGYLLVGVVAAASFYGDRPAKGYLPTADEHAWASNAGDTAVASILYYLLAYAVATLGAFACVSWLGRDKKEASAAHEWSGLAQRHPGIALGMTVCLLSLMGMPPMGGFFGKLFVFRSAFEHGSEALRIVVVIAVVNSVIGAVYYLRLIVSMYFRPPLERDLGHVEGRGAPVVLAAAAALSVLIGIGADAMMQRCRLASAGFRIPPSEARAERVDELRAQWEQREAEADRKAAQEEGQQPGQKAGQQPGQQPDEKAQVEVPAAAAPSAEGGTPPAEAEALDDGG
ncbi:proton-conducting transporter transmembrane domain-containing protein [Paraliomyxa miuraensis]|uniref:proton-conducting transporter transmembrane domain-containing protein n=1 Tax=Paraliomyxa miuraensis TaxID=376150 RepID=UPI0022527168|nr:proton-conducting transporter membrane subunit [Paraliomyxa miuraensis]MCX4243162.1 proton-conducting transporter membrane subunit [Paraliomyxa miuraensis]